MTVRNTALVFVALALASAACTPKSTDDRQTTTSVPVTSTTMSTRAPARTPLAVEGFPEFLATVSGQLLRRNPEEISELGLEDLFSQSGGDLTNLSYEFRTETAKIASDALVVLDTLPPGALTGDDAISASVLRWYLADIVAMAKFPNHEYAVNYITGAHANFPEFLADVHEVTDAQSAESYISRLLAVEAQMIQVADNLRRSERIGVTPTTTGIQIAAWQINNVLGSASGHPLVTDLVDRLTEVDTLSDDEIAAYESDAEDAVGASVLPGYSELLDALNATEGRSEAAPGVGTLPSGSDYYAAVLRHHLSLDLTPDQVHAIGLENVERLVGEVTAVLDDLGYDTGTLRFEGAVTQARDDGGAFPLNTEAQRTAVLNKAAESINEAETVFESMFTTFPASELDIVRPRASRESGSGAYYRPPPIFGTRPGLYYLSLAGPSLDEQTFLTTNYHEAIPGHHFQIALQRESRDLPILQRAATFTGFAEGWALYAERLAFEAGLYVDDPQGNLGRLRMELLRAARVVVDTGIHSLGWSRDEAVEYMTKLGFSEARAGGEVDRYIVWPGQAPAYLIGMLEILSLRSEAQIALGDTFDIAEFHNEVLRHGSIPLDILGDSIDSYIADNL